MAPSNLTSITDIEEQIAKITAELEKARALHYTTTENAFLAVQKRAAAAQAKVNDLNAKGGTTTAAQSRLALAKAALTKEESLLKDAEATFNIAKNEQDAVDEFAKNVALVLAGKKLGKKIKLNKKEKSVLKEEKKSAKKIAQQEKKNAKKQAKENKKKSAKAAEASLEVLTPTTAEKPAAKVAAKKIVAKKPMVKKAAPVKRSETLAALAPEEETSPAETSAQHLSDSTVAHSLNESPATETGKDVVIESETIPASENPATENPEAPIND